MKTLDQIIESYEGECLDGRDLYRLARFVPADRLKEIGLELKDGAEHTHDPLTRENVLENLEEDLAFAFEKALNNRGISASLMFRVIQMWNWILEEGLEGSSEDDYAQYGLPLFKATAEKYGFPNPIGDDAGSEQKYAEDW